MTTVENTTELLTVTQVAALCGRSYSATRKAIDAVGAGLKLAERRAIRPHEVPAIREELDKHRTNRARKQKAATAAT